MLLSVLNLSTEFLSEKGVIKAVDDVSYDLEEGETLSIVGESGCGKTVSALSLMRLIPDPPGRITGGRVMFEGQDLLKLGPEDLCRIRGNRIAMIFQEPMSAFNPVMTVGVQVMEPLMIHRGMDSRTAREECVRLLDMVRIRHARQRVNSYPHELSGGMRQRAMIFITHNLGIVARYADRVLVMYAGRIVEKARTRELFKRPSHPYTIGLLESVPRLDGDARRRLTAIEGQPPDLSCLPPGCPFHPRCPRTLARCRDQRPALRKVSENHEVACWIGA